MSRSRKHHPIVGLAPVASEKPEKQAWHRRMRRTERQHLAVLPAAGEAADAYLTLEVHDVCSDSELRKHGKVWVADPAEQEEAIRK